MPMISYWFVGLLSSASEIIVLTSRCETLGPDWDRNKRDFEDHFASAGQTRIEVEGCTGRVNVTSGPGSSYAPAVRSAARKFKWNLFHK